MKVIILFGPTAVGKTELIPKLFRKKYEILSADSMQVYSSLDLGTAKPTDELRDIVPHHLLDIRSPREQFHVGDFVRLADKLVLEIMARGNIPVICGGTAFYFKNYLFGLPKIPVIENQVKEQVKIDLKKKGISTLYHELEKVDPVRAKKLHPNDKYRILRALEVNLGSGGQLQSNFKPSNSLRKDLDPLIIGLARDRLELYERINQRIDKMFNSGLGNEIKRCFVNGLKETDPGMKGIGYREFFLMKQTGEFTYTDIRNMIKVNSRRYAKRQMTFFKALPNVKWFHPENVDSIQAEIEEFIAIKQ